MEKQIFVSYNKDYDGRSVEGYVISMFCGNTSHGGLVDRLRGAISVYAVCKEIGRDFKINFVHPFNLLDFLVPNKYDWTVASNEISFHKDSSEIIVLDTAVNSSLERRRQKKYLVRRLANRHLNTQTHVYTNAALCYDCNFRQLFNDLFRPSESLQKHLDEIKSQIGGRYISVSARFLNLMGDFNEENYSEPLPFDEQEKLLSECIHRIEILHGKYADCRILVCSDSIRFLEEADRFEYNFVIPGIVSHIGNDLPHSYEYYEKTFLDFFHDSRCGTCIPVKRT